MSMRTEYRRPAGFGATKVAIKAGKEYEARVGAMLAHLRPSGFTLKAQAPRRRGFIDFELRSPSRLFLIEVKSQWSLDAYNQLLYYANAELSYAARICICKIFHPHVPIPEPLECLPLEHLLQAKPGNLTIIPWSNRR